MKKIKQEKDVAIGDMEESTREQVQELRRQIEDRQKDIMMLKSKISTMDSEVEHGEQRRHEQLNKILELENDKRLFSQTKSAIERDLKEKERKVESFDEKYKKLDEENSKYLDQVRDLNQKIRNVEKEKFDTSLQNEEIARKLRDTERKVRDIERKGASQSEAELKLGEIQTDLDDKLRANRRLTENLDKSQEKTLLLEEELRKVKGTVKESENRKGQEARRRDQLELELQAKTEVLNQANDKISELEDLLHEKSISKSTLDRENVRLLESLEDESQIKVNAENRVEKLQEQLSVADDRYKGLAVKLEGISGGKPIPDLQPEIDRLRKQMEEKGRHLTQAEARVARIQRELDAQRQQLPESDMETRQKIKNLKRTVEEEKQRNLQLQEQLRLQEMNAIEGQAELVQGDQRTLDRELTRLRRQMDDRDRKIAAAEETIYKQKEVIEELNNIQKQSEDAAMNEMHGYMSDTRSQFENMRKQLREKQEENAK